MRRALPLIALLAASLIARLGRAVDPRRLDLTQSLASPGAAHPFGCGEGGTDLLARAAEAIARGTSLALGIGVAALIVGVALGAGAGLVGGRARTALERLCDATQSLPTFVLAIAVLSAVAHPGRGHIALVLGAAAWAPFARLSLAEVRIVRDLPYVEAARALGASPMRLLLRHVIPATLPTAMAQLANTSAALLVADAGLSFLGLGPPDGVSLGALVDEGVGAMIRAPHVLVVASGSIVVAVIALVALAAPSARARRV